MESQCSTCDHVREVTSGTGSKFLLCRRSQSDHRFAKYPPQPVMRCEGYEPTSTTATFVLDILPDKFAICRLAADASTPDWARGSFVSVSRTTEELSIVCPQSAVPANTRSDMDWRCLRVAGPLELSQVGVLAELSQTLTSASVPLFVISTFDTDYLLVKEDDLEAAIASLSTAGHVCRR